MSRVILAIGGAILAIGIILSLVSFTQTREVFEVAVDKQVIVSPLTKETVEFHARGLDSTETKVTYTVSIQSSGGDIRWFVTDVRGELVHDGGRVVGDVFSFVGDIGSHYVNLDNPSLLASKTVSVRVDRDITGNVEVRFTIIGGWILLLGLVVMGGSFLIRGRPRVSKTHLAFLTDRLSPR